MIAEAQITLAGLRVLARIHLVVFGGFAPQ